MYFGEHYYTEDDELEREYEEYMERQYEEYMEREAENWAYDNVIIPEYFESLELSGITFLTPH